MAKISFRKGAFLVFLALIALLSLGHSSNEAKVSVSPYWLGADRAHELTLQVSNGNGSLDAINEIRVQKPPAFVANFTCGPALPGWDLASPFGSSICAYATMETALAAGKSLELRLGASFGEGDLYNFTVITKDNGTTGDQALHYAEVRIDREPPLEINLSSPSRGSWTRNSGTLYVSATAEDSYSGISSCEASLDASTNRISLGSLNYSSEEGSCKGVVKLPEKVSEGSHYLSVEERDVSGNARAASVEIKIDNTAPRILSVGAISKGGTSWGFLRPGADAILLANITDSSGSGFSKETVGADLSALTGREDSAKAHPDSCGETSCVWSFQADPSARGRKLATVFASDLSSSDTVFSEASILFDSEAPAVRGLTEVPRILGASWLEYAFYAEDRAGESGVAKGIVSLDGEAAQVTCADKTCNANLTGLSDGGHAIEFYALDGAGNPSEKKFLEFTSDTGKPEVLYGSATFRALSGFGNVVIVAKAADSVTRVEKVFATIDGKRIEMTKASGNSWELAIKPRANLKEEYQIDISAVDSAGNLGVLRMQANLFQILITGVLVHVFGGILLVVFLYWAYTKTIKKHRLEAHYGGYRPSGLGEWLDRLVFKVKKTDLRRLFTAKKEKQTKLETEGK